VSGLVVALVPAYIEEHRALVLMSDPMGL